MRRLQLMEVEDQPWCPAPIRDAMTDYLQFVLNAARPYRAVIPHLREAVREAGTRDIVDLCSGGGGPWAGLLPELNAGLDAPVHVRLTDRFPNLDAWQRLRQRVGPAVDFEPEPVDATRVPERLSGFRTLFTSFHHFPPADARHILLDAVERRQGIGIFEFTERRAAPLVGMLLVPLLVLLTTPAIRPFRWSRLLWTYLVPAVPLFALFDGVVSCLRTYSPEELDAMTRRLGAADYGWRIGQERVRGSAAAVTYLIGVPRPAAGTGSSG